VNAKRDLLLDESGFHQVVWLRCDGLFHERVRFLQTSNIKCRVRVHRVRV